ncbi:hypothetical protein GQ600_13618 [Phytophthora cactorum]|nr:hypothetical protein GQ600_13618 [Phytophthora cactorum]
MADLNVTPFNYSFMQLLARSVAYYEIEVYNSKGREHRSRRCLTFGVLSSTLTRAQNAAEDAVAAAFRGF